MTRRPLAILAIALLAAARAHAAVWHSMPGATNTLVLDTEGRDRDGNVGKWGTDAQKLTVYSNLADAFAHPTRYDPFTGALTRPLPLNLDVTTEDVPYRPGHVWYVHVGDFPGANKGGETGGGPNAYVFPNALAEDAYYVAIAAIHEALHAITSLALDHQSDFDASGNLVREYSQGDGSGYAPWLGEAYYAPLGGALWVGRNRLGAAQDDYAVVSTQLGTVGVVPEPDSVVVAMVGGATIALLRRRRPACDR